MLETIKIRLKYYLLCSKFLFLSKWAIKVNYFWICAVNNSKIIYDVYSCVLTTNTCITQSARCINIKLTASIGSTQYAWILSHKALVFITCLLEWITWITIRSIIVSSTILLYRIIRCPSSDSTYGRNSRDSSGNTCFRQWLIIILHLSLCSKLQWWNLWRLLWLILIIILLMNRLWHFFFVFLLHLWRTLSQI